MLLKYTAPLYGSVLCTKTTKSVYVNVALRTLRF